MSETYPINVMQDRCSGDYSGGRWPAMACATDPVDDGRTRIELGLNAPGGPAGSDVDAGKFWNDAPAWIAVGGTPDEALDNLRKSQT
ncbi:hypothetical protein EJC49_10855 [Aquibium carbonis]|uniref:Uncharacterized protein n=1 Tax=Aquibium carbonis TaxID=2495581 RepID=A0A429YYI9_9HYPH|nr:hypothetical protein EJC49_10855 [Aquibium carbonis]